MAYVHKDVHGGARWCLAHGSLEGSGSFAVCELQRELQRRLPYVLEVRPGVDDSLQAERHLALLGTREDNPLIAELVDGGKLPAPEGAGGYSLAAMDSPWAGGKKAIAVAGADAAGVLHGAIDFCARVLSARATPDDPREMRAALDEIAAMQIAGRPLVDDRGIWTWGYVVYDYRRFIDNMARLKMNALTVWNDCAPLNAREIVDYAHSRGVKVVFGFHWGWGIEGLDLTSGEHLARVRGEVLDVWRREYRDLGCDGIYFQTATEHKTRTIGDRSVAACAREWVNGIAGALLEEAPDLRVQFGLHAISIGEHYADLAGLDPRVSIVWEDAGTIPYSYEPVPEMEEASWSVPEELVTAEKTLEYSKKLAGLRPGCEFAMVAKGWIKLRWGVDFEHHGPFVLGERDRSWIRRRLEERRPRWDEANRLWTRHFPVAARFYREILGCGPPRTNVTGLIEDGMFSEEIPLSAALFAETLWNPRRPDAEILELAGSPYYRLAR
ncbi:MAG: hypothetical protein ACYTGB_04740 [Planctomycetota bacterium]